MTVLHCQLQTLGGKMRGVELKMSPVLCTAESNRMNGFLFVQVVTNMN